MSLGSTQPLPGMNTSIISRAGKGGRCLGLTTLLPSCVECLEIGGASTSWKLHGLYRDCCTFMELLLVCCLYVLLLGRSLVYS
jgi:hypothetical protein